MRFEEGEVTVPGREAGDNVETLGDTLAKVRGQTLGTTLVEVETAMLLDAD